MRSPLLNFSVTFLLCLAVCSLSACEDRTPIDQNQASSQGSNPRGERPERLRAGMSFADFSLPDLTGATRSLSEFRGKLVLINLWATWCAPCVTEMPALERLYQTLREAGFEVVAITVDSPANRQKVETFVTETGLTFPILLDPQMTYPPLVGASGFPESFFIGPDGKLLAFLDPQTKRVLVRIMSDRPWDSPTYIQAIRNLLTEYGINDSSSD